MKRFLTMLLSFMLLFSTSVQAELILEYDGEEHIYEGNIYELYVNGEAVKTPLAPIIFNDRALVPIREIMEALGAQVEYYEETLGIYISREDTHILMAVGKNEVTVNGEDTNIPDGVVPKLIAPKGEFAKTMVPVRFISETLGFLVDFKDGKILISEPEEQPEKEPEEKPSEETKEEQEPIIPVTLQSVHCKQTGKTVKISVVSDEPIREYTQPILTEAGVLYLDIKGAFSVLPSQMEVRKGAVKSVRVGLHEEYVRIALDTEKMQDYQVRLSEDKKTLMIETLKKTEQTKEKIVVIDAGHGDHDGGTSKTYDDILYKEKDIALAIALQTAEILRENDVRVEMTRDDDSFLALTERSAFANELDAALFCSIHINSADSPAANGVEVFYSKTNNGTDYGLTSAEVAQKVLDNFLENTGARNRKVKTEQHVVTRTSIMPAVLVEVGFLSNEEEFRKMIDPEYQYLAAAGIATGIKQSLTEITVPVGGKITETDAKDLGDLLKQVKETTAKAVAEEIEEVEEE